MRTSILIAVAAMALPRVAMADEEATARVTASKRISFEADQERARRSTSGSGFLLSEGSAFVFSGLVGVAFPAMGDENDGGGLLTFRRVAGGAALGIGAVSMLSGGLWAASSSKQRLELHPSQHVVAVGTGMFIIATTIALEAVFSGDSDSGTSALKYGAASFALLGAGAITAGAVWAALSGPQPEPTKSAARRPGVFFSPFGVYGTF